MWCVLGPKRRHIVKLDDYLRERGLSNAAFGARIDKPRQTVERYRLAPDHPRSRIPDRESMRDIYVETGGLVDANSFYALPKLRARAA